ncbi:MAG: class I SAM-dependent methyltransferase [Isosphaeraceae bacterium]
MRDLGDFQTPPELVSAVLDRLGVVGSRWSRVLEPTCGRGHFLRGLLGLSDPPREVRGVEIQAGHHAEASALNADSNRFGVTLGNLFELDLDKEPAWTGDGPLLVVGNPPWVTSSALGVLGSGNHPRKRNALGLRGIDAMTGASNFDLAEAVWIKLLTELSTWSPTIALLGKVSVAGRVLEHSARFGLAVASAWLARIDARAWFGASVEAGLFCMTLSPPGTSPRLPESVPIYPDLTTRSPSGSLGFARGRLVADLDTYQHASHADGRNPIPWRQGVKHDAAAVMELVADSEGRWRNGLGEVVDVEPEFVHPLCKGADLARPSTVARAVLVTQNRPGEDTRRLERTAPKFWAYLQDHSNAFERRKSSIYRDAPPFAMFGIGPYSFSPYKVAVSGLHRSPVFRALGPVGGRPTLLDDTCYLLPFPTVEGCALATVLLNGPTSLGLLRSLAFPGSKRPVTKSSLQRIDLQPLWDRADRDASLALAVAETRRLTGRQADWSIPPERLLAGDGPMDYDG